MLVISEQDINNRTAAIKSVKNYYARRMKNKGAASGDIAIFISSCDNLIGTLDNLKRTIINIYTINADKHAKVIADAKYGVESIFLDSKVQLNDLVAEYRTKLKRVG